MARTKVEKAQQAFIAAGFEANDAAQRAIGDARVGLDRPIGDPGAPVIDVEAACALNIPERGVAVLDELIGALEDAHA